MNAIHFGQARRRELFAAKAAAESVLTSDATALVPDGRGGLTCEHGLTPPDARLGPNPALLPDIPR